MLWYFFFQIGNLPWNREVDPESICRRKSSNRLYWISIRYCRANRGPSNTCPPKSVQWKSNLSNVCTNIVLRVKVSVIIDASVMRRRDAQPPLFVNRIVCMSLIANIITGGNLVCINTKPINCVHDRWLKFINGGNNFK